MAKSLQAKGVPILVLDHDYNHSRWPADFATSDPDEFISVVEANEKCALFIDESGDMIGRYGAEKNMLATRTRHFGHSAFFIVQDIKGLDRVIREQCRDLYTFKIGKKRSFELAEDYVDDNLKEAHLLNKGECLIKIDDNPAYKINVFE